jgi:hypothetical protein
MRIKVDRQTTDRDRWETRNEDARRPQRNVMHEGNTMNERNHTIVLQLPK